MFRKLNENDSADQWEHEIIRTAQNSGRTWTGGKDYLPPAEALRDAGRQQGLSGRDLDRAVSVAQQRSRRHCN